VHWRAFPLHPETPDDGITLEQLFAGRPVDIGAMLQRLKQTATELNLPFGERSMTYNSRLAQEMGLWAEDQGKGDAFHMAAFKAYFADGKNLARESVLMDLVGDVGLPKNEAEMVLKTRSYAAPVDEDWALARQKQVTAVPTFIMGINKLVGAQPYEALVQLMTANKVKRRT
jgi:predicted DsbA family dithiol-disulfide isomerase